MPPTVKPVPVRDRFLRARVGRHDRLGRGRAAPAGEVERSFLHAGHDLVERQRSADDARREDDHLLGLDAEEPCRLERGRPCVGNALVTGRRIRNAGVRDDRLRLRNLEMLARHDDRCCEEAVGREHRSARRRDERAHEREVALAVLADPAVHAAATKALAAVTLNASPGDVSELLGR